jgi:hypothetical protein
MPASSDGRSSQLARLHAVLTEIPFQVFHVEDDAPADAVEGHSALPDQPAHHEHGDAQDRRGLLNGKPPARHVALPVLRHQLRLPWVIELA